MLDLVFLKIKNFFHKLKRSCRWFVRMWNNHDYDDTYLIQVIVWKMKDMLYQLEVVDSNIVDLRNQEHCKYNGYDGDLIKSLEECIEIGERIIADEYDNYPDDVEKWLADHSLSETMPEDIHKLFMKSIDDADKLKDEDNEKFFDIMKKHHWGWWS